MSSKNLGATYMEKSDLSSAFSLTNGEVRIKRKARRRVRCTQDFNQLNRESMLSMKYINSESTKKATTKKQEKLNFLPNIDLGIGLLEEKENSSPNSEGAKKSKRQKSGEKKKKEMPNQNMESTSEEVVFTKRKNTSKKTKCGKSESMMRMQVAQIGNNDTKIEHSTSRRSSRPCERSAKDVKKSMLRPNKQYGPNCEKRSIPSGDIFIEQTLNRTFEVDRKSVMFKSTFEVQDITGDKSVTVEDFHKQEGSLRYYRKSPHVKKIASIISLNKISTSEIPAIDKARIQHNSFSETFLDGNTSLKINKRSTFELPSPIFGPEVPNKSLKPTSPSSSRQEISIINLVTPSPRTSKLDSETSTSSKLRRESTFTLEDKIMDQSKSVKNLLKSPDKNDSEIIQLSNTLKNGRRKWDKSLGVSFLDSSGNIHNISAPWLKEPEDFFRDLPSGTHLRNKILLLENNNSPSESKKMLPATSRFSPQTMLLKDNCSGKSTKKRPKMPNFALIHQRAYDKLENLKEMSERKAARAKLLLTGKKPVDEAPVKRKSPAKSKKLLQYGPKLTEPSNIIVRRTPVVTKSEKLTPSLSNPKALPRLLEKKAEPPRIPKSIKSVTEKRCFTKLGFKVGAEAVKKTTKEEQVKAIVNKSKVVTNTVETRRNIIQNVRSNRRFDLLMKMRNNK